MSEDSKSDQINDAASQAGAIESVGSTFDKRYKILASLGNGATSNVYRAQDILLDRVVALKIIHQSLINNEKVSRRFKAEASNIRSFKHANIASIQRLGVNESGQYYIVLDFVEGESLSEILSRKALSFAQLCTVIQQVADALDHAHSQNLVHCDLKPENIMVRKDDDRWTAVLVDFGIARLFGEAAEGQATQTAALTGSAPYMSPEQCRGQVKLDPRSDIYSLGVVLLECACGTTPFHCDSNFDSMYRHLNCPVSDFLLQKSLPKGLKLLIEKCLQIDPAQRYQTVSEFGKDFSKLVKDVESVKDYSQSGLSSVFANRKKVVALCTIVAGVITVVALKQFKSSDTAEAIISQPHKDDTVIKDSSAMPVRIEGLYLVANRYITEGKHDAAISLIKRWKPKYFDELNQDDQTYYYAILANAFAQAHNFKKAKLYADMVFAEKDQLHANEMLRHSFASLSNSIGNPHDALNHMQILRSRYPLILQNKEKEIKLLEVEAESYKLLDDIGNEISVLRRLTEIQRDVGHGEKAFECGEGNENRIKLIGALARLGKFDEMEHWIGEVESNTIPNNIQLYASTYLKLAVAVAEGGDFERAEPFYLKAFKADLEVNDLVAADYTLSKLCDLLRDKREFSKTKVLYGELLQAVERNKVSKLRTIQITCLSNIASDERSLGEDKKALEHSRAAYDLACADFDEIMRSGTAVERFFSSENPLYQALTSYVENLDQQGRVSDSETVINSAIAKIKDRPCMLLVALYTLQAQRLSKVNEVEKSIPKVVEALAITEKLEPEAKQCHFDLYERKMLLKFTMADLNGRAKRDGEAVALIDSILNDLLKQPNNTLIKRYEISFRLRKALSLANMQKFDLAEREYSIIEPVVSAKFHSQPSMEAVWHWKQFADFNVQRGRLTKALAMYGECIDTISKKFGANNPNLCILYYGQGLAFAEEKQFASAIKSLEMAIKVGDTKPTPAVGFSAAKVILANLKLKT